MNSVITRWEPKNAGCLLDEHHGHAANSSAIIQLAAREGWQPGWEDALAYAKEGVQGGETQDWLADQAMEWLNENIAPEGFSFGWYSGNFFLMDEEWWTEDAQ